MNAIGAWMLRADDKDEAKASRITDSHGLALIALGVGISLDELAIGFSLGLTHRRPPLLSWPSPFRAFLAAQLGVSIGANISEHWRDRAEQIAGIALILLGVYLVIERLVQGGST